MKWLLIEKLISFILNTAMKRVSDQKKKSSAYKKEANRLYTEQMAKADEANSQAERATKVASVLSEVV